MSNEKITLDGKGYAALGNAMLLGRLLAKFEALAGGASRAAYLSRDDCSELEDALFAAGVLDRKIAQAIDISGDEWGERISNTFGRLSKIAASKADITKVRYADFHFPPEISKKYRIADAFSSAKPTELQVPIAQHLPSDLYESIRNLVVDYMNVRAAIDLGLEQAEAEWIGLDGLVTRRQLKEPPKWHLWNSAEARKAREEAGWLEEMREKVRRYVMRPVEEAYGGEDLGCDFDKLGRWLEQNGSSFRLGDVPVCDGLSDLASRLCGEPVVTDSVIDELFPSYGAMLKHKNYGADADPFNAFAYLTEQVAWFAVEKGWALCIAEDGLDGRCFSWVPPDAFPRLNHTGDLALPQEIGVAGCFELTGQAKFALGADRLWFALTKEVAAALGMPEATQAESSEEPKPAKEFNKGFTQSDAKFIEEGLKWWEEGNAKSALNAAQKLISQYGVVLESDWVPGRSGIRSYSITGAESRLQRAISAERKKRKQQGNIRFSPIDANPDE